MKKIWILGLLAVVLIAAALPPALPSSFYGVVTGVKEGAKVSTNFTGTTRTFAWNDLIVYSMNVTEGVEGATVFFSIKNQVCGTGVYHTGSNQQVNLSCRIRKTSPSWKRFQ